MPRSLVSQAGSLTTGCVLVVDATFLKEDLLSKLDAYPPGIQSMRGNSATASHHFSTLLPTTQYLKGEKPP